MGYLVEELRDEEAMNIIRNIQKTYFHFYSSTNTFWENLVSWYNMEIEDFTEEDNKNLKKSIE